MHDLKTKYLHNNPDAYWCADCWKFTLDCSHLLEPLTSPEVKLDNFQYLAVTWQRNVLQVTMNTGERYHAEHQWNGSKGSGLLIATKS